MIWLEKNINKKDLIFDKNDNAIISLPRGFNETNIIKAVFYREDSVAIDETPKWFEAFEKRNDAHWEKQEKFNDMVIKRLDGIDVRLDGIDERIDGIEKRLDGIVNSNELKDPNNE